METEAHANIQTGVWVNRFWALICLGFFFLAHLWTILYFHIKLEAAPSEKLSVVSMMRPTMPPVSRLFHLSKKSEKTKFSAVILSVVFLLWVLRVCSFSNVYDKPIKRLWQVWDSSSISISASAGRWSWCARVPFLCFNCTFDCLTVAGRVYSAGASDYQINLISLVDDVSKERPANVI